MTSKIFNAVILVLCVNFGATKMCYWNNFCPYQLFSTKTPYDVVRGDIREYPVPENCEAVSIWALIRHGHRYAKEIEVTSMKAVAELKKDIIASYHSGTSQLCRQDIEDLENWKWLDNFQSSTLSGIGYAELVSLGRRMQEKYPQLLDGSLDDVYIRATNRVRTESSAKAFVTGLTEKTTLSVTVDQPLDKDDVIQPYEYCQRYLDILQNPTTMTDQVNACDNSGKYKAVMANVQRRLGIAHQLTADDVYNLYELCRSSRLWNYGSVLRSPWCAMFSDQDLEVMEFKDDIKRYYKNGYGLEESVGLGSLPLRDLYEKMVASSKGEGKKLVAYFSHKTLTEMVVSAIGLFKDKIKLDGSGMKPNRLWRSSEISCSSSNIIAVLLRCKNFGVETHHVQIFQNEKPTDLCPLQGCTWQEFTELFQNFASANLSFCNNQEHLQTPGSAANIGLKTMAFVLVIVLFLVYNKERLPCFFIENHVK
ncbi:hypothetical protein ACJJTC_010574 [Scirpophaga incertulas]